MISILAFHVGDARFGIRSADAREVVRAVALTPLAGAPACVDGIFNLRGDVVAVLDLRKRFRLPAKSLSADEHFLVLAGRRPRAFRADRVVEIADVPEALVEAHASARVAGVARTEDGLAVILDLDAFLDEAESAALDASLDALEALEASSRG